MQKVSTIQMDKFYPFGKAQEHSLNSNISVKLHLTPKNQTIQQLLDKIAIARTLKHQCLIKMQSLLEEDEQYYLNYEYVPYSIQTWSNTVSRQYIENMEQRIILLSRFLADQNISLHFNQQSLGVTKNGEPKYYLDLAFKVDSQMDKIATKKKYKEQIRQLFQYYIDKKNNKAFNSNLTKTGTEKKQNSKVLKILQAIQKGKANLLNDPQNQNTTVAVQQNKIEPKSTLKPIKNIQNVFIQKEVNKINIVHKLINNKPTQILQTTQFKRQYAINSFYINGMPLIKLEKQGQIKKVTQGNDKLNRFEEVKYKQYKTLTNSNEVYVQDFLNVLESQQTDKIKPITSTNRISLALEDEKTSKMMDIQYRGGSPKTSHLFSLQNQKNLQNNLSEQQIKVELDKNELKTASLMDIKNGINSSNKNNATSQLQRKVSEAIANSLSAINKFKKGKN